MNYSDKDYPHADISNDIISAAFYVANGYKYQKLSVFDDADKLHDKFRDDINALLNKREIFSVTEKHIPKPLKNKLIRDKKIRHFADLMVKEQVLVEIKTGTGKYLFSEESLSSFEGQCLNTLEYSDLDVILLLRLPNDGNWRVHEKRFAKTKS